MLILWHAFCLRPFSNAPRKKKKNEPLSKNGNCRIGRKTQNQICRGHLGSGSSIRSIHRLHSIPLHCIAFHRSIPLHSTALHSIDPSTPSHSTRIHSNPFHSISTCGGSWMRATHRNGHAVHIHVHMLLQLQPSKIGVGPQTK